MGTIQSHLLLDQLSRPGTIVVSIPGMAVITPATLRTPRPVAQLCALNSGAWLYWSKAQFSSLLAAGPEVAVDRCHPACGSDHGGGQQESEWRGPALEGPVCGEPSDCGLLQPNYFVQSHIQGSPGTGLWKLAVGAWDAGPRPGCSIHICPWPAVGETRAPTSG